jgi:hypothetical protein
MATGLAVASAAFVGVGLAAQQAYATLRAGAELQTTTERFGKLAASIGTTADVMLGKLREATKGMISDAELMASASGIVSLKLADNEEQVVRLATVVGTLGWDMQQVILTFANLSTMRLDALGLSVDEVKQKQKELMDQGMSTAAAFKEAVIQAGEARLDVGGVSESEAGVQARLRRPSRTLRTPFWKAPLPPCHKRAHSRAWRPRLIASNWRRTFVASWPRCGKKGRLQPSNGWGC